MDRGGPQVGVGAEQLPKRQEPGLGAPACLGGRERRVPDRAEEDGVGLPDGGAGPRGSESPASATPAAPTAYSAVSRPKPNSSPAAWSTRRASAVTSGPMPSPGRTAIV